MGLEYMKHKETGRHNIADELIRSQGNVIQKQEADTRSYSASFEPQRVAATTKQAESSSIQATASQKQADVALAKFNLDRMFRERETRAKEISAYAADKQSEAALTQADIAEVRALLEEYRLILDNLSGPDAASFAAEIRGDSKFEQFVAGLNEILRGLIPKLSFSLK